MEVLKNDDKMFRDYPILKTLFDQCWKFLLDEYDDPHHGRPEADYYAQSPRMGEHEKFAIYMRDRDGDSLETIIDREARVMSQKFTKTTLPDIENVTFIEYLKYFKANTTAKNPTANFSVTIE